MDPALRKTAFSPLVLWAAWLRIDHWYRSANLPPQPELALWRNHPEAELRTLGNDLREGSWKPDPWPQVPYPKKGSCLRHMYLPTVRDQVAFMAHMVLLGPLLDAKLSNFVFGSRWYRPIAWNTRRQHPSWKLLPYPFRTHHAFLPYARDHGLYRRVAHWSAARMTNTPISTGGYGASDQLPEDYRRNQLPEWTKKEWWQAGSGDHSRGRGWWATLDLQLAFPSVKLDRLRGALHSLLGADAGFQPLHQWLHGYPEPVLRTLEDSTERQQVADGLVKALHEVTIQDGGKLGRIPEKAWRPHHCRADLPPENLGLPTGLAVSGLLLNAALAPADQDILEHLDREKTAGKDPGAFLRFADDMTVLARSRSGLFMLIDVIWAAISDSPNGCLADPRSDSNLHFNLAKISPEPLGEMARKYLSYHDWNECDDCEELDPPTGSSKQPRLGLANWWKQVKSSRSDDHTSLCRSIRKAAIVQGNVAPFVTFLVERMSKTAKDTLADRFGEGARERLERLHDLARLDFADDQVRPDTRRAFAVNRLVRAWLPGDRDETRQALRDIRESVATVLRVTPWKFALWRAVVRAAARRPHGERPRSPANDDREYDTKDAMEWMTSQLRTIACKGSEKPSWDSWIQDWPEEPNKQFHRGGDDDAWRDLYLSY